MVIPATPGLGDFSLTLKEGWSTPRTAEKLGYSMLFVADHLPVAAAPLLALAAAAEATTALRVGTLVLNNDFRHPVMLAKEAATLDVLSGGRLELGLGAGWAKFEYDQAGLVYEGIGR